MGILNHRISTIPRRSITLKEGKPSINIIANRHVRVLTCWRNGEVSWVPLDALKDQNPWILIKYAQQRNLTKHPDFLWTTRYLDNKASINQLIHSQGSAAKSHHGLKFKFGVQIPSNPKHAFLLDKIHNNTLWEDATKAEIDSINSFETFSP